MVIIGTDTIGGTTIGPITGDTTIGGLVTCNVSGTLRRIVALTNIVTSGTAPMRVAVFNNTPSNTIGPFIGSSPSFVNVTNTTPQWIGVDLNAFVQEGFKYWLFAWVDPSGFSSAYNMYETTGGVSNAKATAFGIPTFGDWAQVGDGVNENYSTSIVSIYGEVDAGIGTPSLMGVQSLIGVQSIII